MKKEQMTYPRVSTGQLKQCTLDYACANCPVCGLSVQDCKLLMNDDRGGN